MKRTHLKVLVSLVCLSALLSWVSSSAQAIDLMTEEAVKEGMLLEAKRYSGKGIPDNIKSEAERLYGIIKKDVMPKVREFQDSMEIDNNTGAIVFNERKSSGGRPKDNKASEGYFKKDERLYIFISSSIPETVLKSYSRDIEYLGIGSSAVFVMRGCVPSGGRGGCGDFGKTMDFVKAFVLNDGKGRKNALWIDPVLFSKYGVREVPAFVYAKNVERIDDMGSEGDWGRLKRTPSFWLSVGDWSLEYHIKELYKKSRAESLRKIVDSIFG